MKQLFVISTFICVLCSGCARFSVMEISVPPVDSSPSESNRLTSESAVRLFAEVAAQSGFEVRGPILQPTRYGSLVTFTALPTPTNKTVDGLMDAYITTRQTVFQCRSHTFSDAANLALTFERALDEQGIRYSVTRTTANPLNN